MLDCLLCGRACDTSNVGANNKPGRSESPPHNINYYLPFEDTPIREVPPLARLPTTYFFVTTRSSA